LAIPAKEDAEKTMRTKIANRILIIW